jgi:indole-3-glycerol phosphate synthase
VPGILERILAAKRREVEAARKVIPEAEMRQRAEAGGPQRGFASALRAAIAGGRPAVIAEIKRASPSQGLIRADLDPARIASSYERHGATCLSVLTDHEFFGGSLDDLKAARAACGLPVLRKDFVIDRYQVYEARAAGADCILLIIDAAPDSALEELGALARSLGMDVLVESHDGGQLQRALDLPDDAILGINNRDLHTFRTQLETTLDLLQNVPAGRILVTESGISSPSDVQRLKKAGVSAYLVGTAFVGATDPGVELEALFFGP